MCLSTDPNCVNPATINIPDVKSNSMVLKWAEPATPNGQIKYYNVTYVDTCNKKSSWSEVNVTEAALIDLHPYTEYNLTVTPWTQVGPSPKTCGTRTDRTRVGGEYITRTR